MFWLRKHQNATTAHLNKKLAFSFYNFFSCPVIKVSVYCRWNMQMQLYSMHLKLFF